MAQFHYDVVDHKGGFAIEIAPARADAFPTRQAAFDAAAELARKLRFVGIALDVRVHDEPRHPHMRNRRTG